MTRLAIQLQPADARDIARSFRRRPRHMDTRRIVIAGRRRTVSVVTDVDGDVRGATLHCAAADVLDLRAWGYDIPASLATL